MILEAYILQVGVLQKSSALRAKSSSVVIVNVQRDKVQTHVVLISKERIFTTIFLL